MNVLFLHAYQPVGWCTVSYIPVIPSQFIQSSMYMCESLLFVSLSLQVFLVMTMLLIMNKCLSYLSLTIFSYKVWVVILCTYLQHRDGIEKIACFISFIYKRDITLNSIGKAPAVNFKYDDRIYGEIECLLRKCCVHLH